MIKRFFCFFLSVLLTFSLTVTALATEASVEPENEPVEVSEPEQVTESTEPENEPTEPSEPVSPDDSGSEAPDPPDDSGSEAPDPPDDSGSEAPDPPEIDNPGGDSGSEDEGSDFGGSEISVTNKNGVTINLIDTSYWNDYKYHIISYSSENDYYYYYYSDTAFYCSTETATKFRYAEDGICGYGNVDVTFSWDERQIGDAYALSKIIYSDHDISVSNSETVKYYSDGSDYVQPQKFTVSFVTGFDDFNLDPVEVVSGTVLSLPDFTYPNYNFVGLYTDENFENLFIGTPVTEDITLYLKFEEIESDNSDLVASEQTDLLEGILYIQTVQSVLLSVLVIGFFFFRRW